jgi:hypothetical protein
MSGVRVLNGWSSEGHGIVRQDWVGLDCITPDWIGLSCNILTDRRVMKGQRRTTKKKEEGHHKKEIDRIVSCMVGARKGKS